MTAPTGDDPKMTGAHYTPRRLAAQLARRLVDRLDEPDRPDGPVDILDPACGDGQLLEALTDQLADSSVAAGTVAGIDTDDEAVGHARRRLGADDDPRWRLVSGDFLNVDADPGPRPLVLNELTADNDVLRPDLIVANPPYVRTQVLGTDRTRHLAEAFDLKGRLDLYQAFLVVMTTILADGGLMAVITSNKFLTTESAGVVRQFLFDHLEILELVDLGDTRLFDAAVLPAILVARKADPDRESTGAVVAGDALRAYEAESPADSDTTAARLSSREALLSVDDSGTYRIDETDFSVVVGSVRIPPSPDEPWSVLSADEVRWLRTVDDACRQRLGELCDVRVGIKTNADEVFVRDDWSDLPADRRPEDELLHPLVTQSDAARWRAATDADDRPKVLYPHRQVDGSCQPVDLSDFPGARAYLRGHEDRLRQRTYLLDAGRRWYEHWVPHRPDRWFAPKIVLPDISTEPVAFVDDDSIVKGSCYWMSTDDRALLYRLLGLLNSSVVDRYHDLAFQNRLYAGRRRYLTQYVQKYPVPDLETEPMDRVEAAVRQLVETSPETDQRRRLEQTVEDAVRQAFGL